MPSGHREEAIWRASIIYKRQTPHQKCGRSARNLKTDFRCHPLGTNVYTRVDDAPQVVLVGSLILSEMEKLFIPAKTNG